METTGCIKSINKRLITIELDDDVNFEQLRKFANGKQPTAIIQLNDGRGASPEQTKKSHALANEFGEYTGYKWFGAGGEESMAVMKWLYNSETGNNPYFSFKDCSMSEAAEFITWQITYMIEHDIPFKTRLWDELADSYYLQRLALKKRVCVICGAINAQVAHYKAVGAGMNRNFVDPTNYKYMSLCAEHHAEQHAIGIKSFCQKYIIKPIKLDRADIKEFKIIGRLSDEQTRTR